MAVSKILIDGVGIDLTSDTVTSADDIAEGKVGHLNTGEVVTGTHSGGGTVNSKVIDLIIASDLYTKDYVLLCTDTDAASHYGETNLKVSLLRVGDINTGNAIIYMMSANNKIASWWGFYAKSGANDSYYTHTYETGPCGANLHTNYAGVNLRVIDDGRIMIRTNDNSIKVASGNYKLIISWG